MKKYIDILFNEGRIGNAKSYKTTLSVDTFKNGTKLYVDEVHHTNKDELMFVIHEGPYLCKFFRITIQF